MFQLQTLTNTQLVVEHAASLPAANWTILTNVVGDGSSKLVIDPAPGAERRYYRARVSP